MEITEAQYERIKDALPVQRGNVRLSNLQVLNAVLYVAEQGCKWRGVPKRFGRWHTIYMRMNRWSKSGVLDRVFEKMQAEQIVRIKIEAFALDSTSIKVHPDGTGALKKRTTGHRQVARRMEHQGSSGCRERSNGHHLRVVARQRSRRTRRTRPVDRTGSHAGGLADADGSRLRGRRDQATGTQPGHDPGGSAQVKPHRAMGIRSRPIQKAQRNRAAVQKAQRLPQNLLSLRETRCPLPRLPHLHPHHRSPALV